MTKFDLACMLLSNRSELAYYTLVMQKTMYVGISDSTRCWDEGCQLEISFPDEYNPDAAITFAMNTDTIPLLQMFPNLMYHIYENPKITRDEYISYLNKNGWADQDSKYFPANMGGEVPTYLSPFVDYKYYLPVYECGDPNWCAELSHRAIFYICENVAERQMGVYLMDNEDEYLLTIYETALRHWFRRDAADIVHMKRGQAIQNRAIPSLPRAPVQHEDLWLVEWNLYHKETNAYGYPELDHAIDWLVENDIGHEILGCNWLAFSSEADAMLCYMRFAA